ncbi:MAG: SRPBCC family protein [Bacteroidia bacterium]|nr:SRPBCC family protein [Bacteroidia bacterium]NNL33750.1 SRPBCC family protein [Flavobacteriaceae bacterium]
MKFEHALKISQHRDKVASYFADPSLLHHFQDGFISKELLEGDKGKTGAKSKMIYKRLELIETILENNLPDSFYALYEHKYTVNTMLVKFQEQDHGSTLYIMEIEYTQFNGFFMKLMAKLMPGMFKKQVLKWMHQFKDYCEKN